MMFRTWIRERRACWWCRADFIARRRDEVYCTATCGRLARGLPLRQVTHCSLGHELTEENTRRWRDGRRRCRLCKRRYDHARYLRQRDAREAA